MKRKYGITVEEYDRMLYVQRGLCAICGSDSPGAKWRFFAVDHDHATGEVRGLLCNSCNAGLGKFADDPGRLAAAILYLEKSWPSI